MKTPERTDQEKGKQERQKENVKKRHKPPARTQVQNKLEKNGTPRKVPPNQTEKEKKDYKHSRGRGPPQH